MDLGTLGPPYVGNSGEEVSLAVPSLHFGNRHPKGWLQVPQPGGLLASQSDASGSPASNRPTAEIRHPENNEKLALFPHSCAMHPGLPSPWKAPDGREILVGRIGDGRFTLLLVTVENGDPVNWCTRRFNKGRQLVIDQKDFPVLATTELHDNYELDRITTITGRSLDEINRLGRPNGLSSPGFFAADEDIISVLKGHTPLARRSDRHCLHLRPEIA